MRAELDFYLAREQEAAALMDLCRAGKLRLRVTHNDTKLNNVMLDRFHPRPALRDRPGYRDARSGGQ